MRVALLADVHANLPALEAVLDELDRERFDRILCLGDVVGYNATPAEVVDRLRERADVIVVAGNHDRDILFEAMPGTSSPARQVSAWTRGNLGEAALAWLSGLGSRHLEDAFVGVHGCYLNDSHVSGYVTDTMLEHNLRALLERRYPRLAFCGHTHVPMLGVLRDGEGTLVGLSADRTVSFRGQDEAVIVNPGSVGQPRDGDPRASYAVVDVEAREVSFRRVCYDVDAAASAIVRAGLPRSLAERLRAGV